MGYLDLELKVGHLLKKIYSGEEVACDVFKYVDYVVAITIGDVCSVVTGDYNGECAYNIGSGKNKIKYLFIEDDLEEAIKENDYSGDFNYIRKRILSTKAEYYIKKKKNRRKLKPVTDSKLIKLLREKCDDEYASNGITRSKKQ